MGYNVYVVIINVYFSYKRCCMKVLLLDTVEKLGKVGDVCEVADGHARNFLFPRSLAIRATDSQIKNYQLRVKKLRDKLNKEVNESKDLAAKLSGKVFNFKKKTTEDGKLFGAVNSKEIEELLQKEGVNTDQVSLNLSKLKKKIGEYEVVVDFGHEIKSKIMIRIEKAE